MGPSVEMTFVSHRREAVNKILDYVGGDAQQSFMDVAMEVSKDKCPVDTGTLQNSIQWKPVSLSELHFFTETGYGAHVELGTSKRPGVHFMLQGMLAGAEEFEEAFPQ